MRTWVGLLVLLVAPSAGAQPGEPSAVEPPAFADASHSDPAVRRRAADALADLQTMSAHQHLVMMLRSDRDSGVREASATALGRTRNADVAGALKQAAEADPDSRVRQAARDAYEKLWPFGKGPGTAFSLSLLCPGCGQLYIRKRAQGVAYLGSTAALLAGGITLLLNRPARGTLGNLDDPALDPDDPIGIQLILAGQNLWFYSMFAAYRDARILRGDHGYRYPVSRERLVDLTTAPFRPSVLRRAWFWAGLPVMVGAAIGFTALVSPADLGAGRRSLLDGGGVNFLGRRYGTGSGLALGEAYYGALFLPVGVGEEALFRGVIQPGLSESMGVWGGWALASAIFGIVHVGNFLGGASADIEKAALAVPFITGVGSYLGVVSIKNGFTLETSVALHFWYDFLLGTASFITDPDHQPFVARFGAAF